jgi:beta-aspartyl-peptidase (threonine type)
MTSMKRCPVRASFTPGRQSALKRIATVALGCTALAAGMARAADAQPIAIVIHGGAGVINRNEMTAEREALYRAGLEAARDAGYAVLEQGGTSLDAVVTAVRHLEDNPLFNAGRGAVLNSEGKVELDASIMDGKTLRAGAVANVRHVKNPIELARRVMEGSRHVMLVGEGAEEFALAQGMTLVPNEYFRTDARLRQLERVRKQVTKNETKTSDARESPSARMPEEAGSRESAHVADETTWHMAAAAEIGASGTVGAVALDRHGNLAAATSTGGMTNKLPGRVGDSPIIGAGTYANDASCAVSATGDGEFFIRSVVAHDICARVEYKQAPLAQAAREVIHEKVGGLKATGGVIALDRKGTIVMEFNSEGMFRASRDSRGRRDFAIYADR